MEHIESKDNMSVDESSNLTILNPSTSSVFSDPTSPFLKGKELYDSCRKGYRMRRCASCSVMYLTGCESYYLNSKPIVLANTDHGLYIRFRNTEESMIDQRSLDMLLYGVALKHTDRCFNLKYHTRSQAILLMEAYDVLRQGKTKPPEEDMVILYMELMNPMKKAKFIDGKKCTHPHVWILNRMQKYDGKRTLYSPIPFIPNQKFFYDFLMNIEKERGLCLKTKTYVKFYIEVKSYKIIQMELDIDVKSSD